MRAVSLRGGELALREIPTPVPGPGQVLVRTRACAVCASDVHYMEHPEVALEDRSGMRVYDAEADVVMGHEFVAEVVEYGPDTEQTHPVGTRVTCTPSLFTDGKLRIVGMAPDAPGGWGEYFLLNASAIRPVPDGVPDEIAALIDAMAVGWYYTRRIVGQGERVPLVVGLGAIGLTVVAALRQRGIGPIVAADFSPERRRIAQELGADVVVDPREESPYAAWRQAAWGAPEEIHDRIALFGKPGCAVFECVGREGVLADIVDQAPLGTMILSAGGAPKDTIASATAKLKGLNIQFGGGPAPEDWYGAMDLVISGDLDPRPLIGSVIGLEELADAVRTSSAPDAPVRIIWKPEAQ